MVINMVGKGSKYPFAYRDADGDYLSGGRTYKLNIPGPVPLPLGRAGAPSGRHRANLEHCHRTRLRTRRDRPNVHRLPLGSYLTLYRLVENGVEAVRTVHGGYQLYSLL
jgi:hypothetical protein